MVLSSPPRGKPCRAGMCLRVCKLPNSVVTFVELPSLKYKPIRNRAEPARPRRTYVTGCRSYNCDDKPDRDISDEQTFCVSDSKVMRSHVLNVFSYISHLLATFLAMALSPGDTDRHSLCIVGHMGYKSPGN
eukprot:scaffold250091_cov49-Prasinocladus_malaysianus.AAC.1